MSPTYNKISENLLQEFKKIVGEDSIFTEKEHRWTYTFGSTMFEPSWVPDLILMPKNMELILEDIHYKLLQLVLDYTPAIIVLYLLELNHSPVSIGVRS